MSLRTPHRMLLIVGVASALAAVPATISGRPGRFSTVNDRSAPPFSTLAAAINDLGVIAGSYLDASSNVGAVVGFYLDSSGKFHGFELSPAR
jgi:hypothetical protein